MVLEDAMIKLADIAAGKTHCECVSAGANFFCIFQQAKIVQGSQAGGQVHHGARGVVERCTLFNHSHLHPLFGQSIGG
ncbi:hypothetical protein D9M71_428330 [compost metagenome]